MALQLAGAQASAADAGTVTPGGGAGRRIPVITTNVPARWSHDTKAVSTAHVLFLTGRAATWGKRYGTVNNDSGDDFALELAGRQLEVSSWKQPHPGETDAELDLLLDIDAEGFLAEAIILTAARPGWTVPADALRSLRVPAFLSWAKTHLEGKALDRGTPTSPASGKLWPDAPGAKLPDPSDVERHPESTCQKHETFDAAVVAWRAEAARLDGAPLVARSALDFLLALDAVKTYPVFAARGATWVDQRVGFLHYYSAYCAVEREAWGDAESNFSTAAAMMPNFPRARIDLADTFLRVQQPDTAVPILEQVRGDTTEPCELAAIWRKLGYARYDQGRFAESVEAWEVSLDYQPDHPLAVREVAYARTALKKRGAGRPPGAAVTPRPTVTTRCASPGR